MIQSVPLRLAAAALLVSFGATQVRAQVVIDMTYGANTCSFTTNAAGTTLDSVSGHLLAANTDATAFSGACGGTPAPSPTITQQLQSNVASPVVNTAFTLSWNTSNVDYCKTDGSVFPAGATATNWPLSGNICTGAACAPGSATVTASLAGAYTFNLQCFKTGNSTPATTTLNLTVQSGGGGTSCAGHEPVYASRQTSTSLKITANGTIYSVDGNAADAHDQIFGRNLPPNGNTWRAFQQRSLESTAFSVLGNSYLALAFNTSPTFSTTAEGDWDPKDTPWLSLPLASTLTYSLSECPGDFNVPAGCKATWSGPGTEGPPLVYIGPDIVDPSGSFCKIYPSKTYFLNFITTNGQNLTSTCSGGNCQAFVVYHFYQ